ncbi:MAG: DUF6968 family protein [Terracidiphilus sp.]
MNSDLAAQEFDVIAERALDAIGDGGSFEVRVRLGKPTPHPKGDWACPFQITGIGDEKVRLIFGVDAVQALQLAMVAVGSHLSTHQKKAKLAFLSENHLGFPRTTLEATGSCPYCRSEDVAC